MRGRLDTGSGSRILIDRRTRSRLLSDTLMPAARISPSSPQCRRFVRGPVPVSISVPMLATLLIVCLCSAQCFALPRVQKHESRREIDQLEDTWREATLKGNTTVLAGLLADDYMAITASGTLQTKDQALASMRSGHTHFTTLDISDRKVRFYGTTAIVTSVAEVKGTTADGDVSGSFRYSRVYVRDLQGAWRVVSFEVSRIRDLGDRGDHSDHK